jgi:RHS repeat-associated protein
MFKGKLRNIFIACGLILTVGAASMPSGDAAGLLRDLGSAIGSAFTPSIPAPAPASPGPSRTPASAPQSIRTTATSHSTAAARSVTSPQASSPGHANLPKGDDQPFGFTGYVKDPESGLYYAGACYYDPQTARFTTEDPEPGRDREPPSLHRYLYAYANPTAYTDSTGRASLESQRLAYQQPIDMAPNPQARATAEAVMREYEANRYDVGMEAAKSSVVSMGLAVGGAYVAEGVAIGRAMYATYVAYGASAAYTQHGPAAVNYAATGVEAAVSIATGANAPSAVPLAAAESAAASMLETDVPVAPVASMTRMEISRADGLASSSPRALTVAEGADGSTVFVASRSIEPEALPDPRRLLDLSARFEVSPMEGGTKFQYGDPAGWAEVGHDSHGIVGFVDRNGVLGFDVFANPELRETYGSGQDMFSGLWARIRQENVEVAGIRGAWMKGTDSVNYAQYRDGIASGLTPQQAAAATWTGQRAAERGYSEVESVTDRGNVQAIFRKPKEQ